VAPDWCDPGDNYDEALISVVVEEGGRFGEYGRLEVSKNFIAHSERSLSAACKCWPDASTLPRGLGSAIGVLS